MSESSVSDRSLETLISSRNSLKSSLDKSKAIALSLTKTTPRFIEIEHRLPSLESAVRPIRADREALVSVSGHINRAVGPAAAVLKVFDAVHGLEKSLLSDPKTDLSGYLSVLKRLEEALNFLGENCGLAIQWLEDIVEYLEDHNVADEKYISKLKSSLRELREGEKEKLDGGLREAALVKLENEFQRLLKDNSVPLPMSSPSSSQACIAPSQLPVNVIHKLQAIIVRLKANKRLQKCISIYIEVRSMNVRASLKALDLDYLEIAVSEFSDVQSIESYISQWGNHLEFAVKHLFEAEFKLCNEVFERIGFNDCFSKIASQAGMLKFLQFGNTVTQSKKDPIKLLKLLDIFTSLNKLRSDFNRLFGGEACVEIQSFTRDLIKKLINNSAEIFWELLVQVEIQKQISPPKDGSVPRLVSFVTDYCNKLVGDKYKSTLTQVLFIDKSWRREEFQENQLMIEVLRIIKAVEMNLDVWMKAYQDQTLSHFFGMNNHYHLYKSLKGTRIGEKLGDSWLKEHDQYKEYYFTVLIRDSWGKLPSYLSREGLILFSGGHATARDLVKKRLKSFNEAFDEVYKKQSLWVLQEKDLRERVCLQIVQAVVPVYRSYMQNYGPLVEKEAKYVRYSVVDLEKILNSLYVPKPMRYGSFKGTPPSEKKLKNGVDIRRTTSAVA